MRFSGKARASPHKYGGKSYPNNISSKISWVDYKGTKVITTVYFFCSLAEWKDVFPMTLAPYSKLEIKAMVPYFHCPLPLWKILANLSFSNSPASAH